MIAKRALADARKTLADGRVEDAPLEAEVLLRDVLKKTRAQLHLELEVELDPQQDAAFRRLIERRLDNEPTAYIRGHREFYRLDFLVDRRVLVPRPETELLVDKTVELAGDTFAGTIADVGTGSGVIAVCLALDLPEARVYATDVSAAALEVARLNCERHGVAERVSLLAGDLLEALPEMVDIIVANLPYVGTAELSRSRLLDAEPRIALDGGADGLAVIRRLCLQVTGALRPGGHLLVEVGQGQAPEVAALLASQLSSARIELVPDLAGIDRMVHLSLS